jgi:hypothetical protein
MSTEGLPGTTRRSFAEQIFDRVTLERVILPALADLQHECEAAAGSPSAVRRIRWRAYWSVWRTVALCLLRDTVRDRQQGTAVRATSHPSIGISSSATTFARVVSEGWRRGRDSNPWKPSGFNGFQDRRLKPLGHLSGLFRTLSLIAAGGRAHAVILSSPPMYCRRASGTTTEPSACW